ncbi:Metalloenzyme, LuxS/M16 peptidase-like protein [Cynara cardunculus var. scolymus]|uniref:Metalloenzyme, LuxS/M16 peptidase-like protein n=1 Tax=Cynara cardunculus var. scolymus TaxID=59895 RepID=A0A103YN96_CYNCS|nr:Metalloenzyme, LuxS/M16 peptidase-like protein [Cynara cardunculus var. scolymus]
MYRAASSRIRSLKGHVGNRTLARFASSSAVAAKSSSGGLFSWFTGGSSSSLPPLDFPLKGIELPSSLPDHVETGKTKITTLPNGVRIASETSANPAASIGLYVNSGSMYETPVSFGATHLLERMAFKSTTNRSHLRVVREVEAIGGNVTASASREQMGYTYDALKTYVPQMVELLVDSVRNQAFLDWEVTEQIQKVKAEIAEYANNSETLLLEAIHSAGYSGALANALLASEGQLNSLNSTVLEEFVAANYTAPRIVLAASGVEHEELLKYAEPLLSDLPGGAHVEEPKSVYVGGDHRVMADTGRTSFALAFELPGGWLKEKDAMTLTVLQMLMGGGGSFSAGGPGKGMYSRLCKLLDIAKLLISYFCGFEIFAYAHNTTLYLMIVQLRVECLVPTLILDSAYCCEQISESIDVAAKELIAVATNGEVNQVQLDRAKQSTKSAILMNLESRMVASEDIGRQILTYGERKPVEFFLKAVDEVSAKDIASIAQKLLSSPLTMATHGDVSNVPTYDSVSSKFH